MFTNKIHNNKKNFKPRKISKHKIKDIRKLSKFQRLKHRLDAISLNQRHEDSNQNTKSSGGDSDSEHTPLNNYTIKIKGDMEEYKEMEEQGNQRIESRVIKLDNDEIDKIICQSSEDSQNRSSNGSSSDQSVNDSNNNLKTILDEEMDGIVDLPMSMKQIPSPATSIKKRYNKITFTSKTVKQKIGLKMKNFKSLDNEPSSQRKLDIDTGNMFSQRQLAYYNDFKQKINSPLFKRPERLISPSAEKQPCPQVKTSEQKHQSIKKIYSNIPTDILSKKEFVAACRNYYSHPTEDKKQYINKISNYQKALNGNKVMQGSLNQVNSFTRRYKSPQYKSKNYIMLPSFDRGRRKISKMGGEQFSFTNTLPVFASTSPQGEMGNPKSRRFTSTSPGANNKMISNIMKTNTLNLDNHELFEKESNDKTFDQRRFIETIPEVQVNKSGYIEAKRKNRSKAATKISRNKRNQPYFCKSEASASSRLQKQSTNRSKDLR